MTRRVLVCIQDTGVAHVVASRLQKDGMDGTVVDSPSKLLSDEEPVDAIVVQDKYPGGERGKQILETLSGSRAHAVNAVFLMSGDLGASEETELRALAVRSFLRIEATPHSIAVAVRDAVQNKIEVDDFDISIDSKATDLGALGVSPPLEDFSANNEDESTVEVTALDMAKLRQALEDKFEQGAATSRTSLDGAPATVAEVARDDSSESEMPSPMTVEIPASDAEAGAMFEHSDAHAAVSEPQAFELPSLKEQAPVESAPAEPAIGGEDYDDDTEFNLDALLHEENPPDEKASGTDNQSDEDNSVDDAGNDVMQLQELKKAMRQHKMARELAEQRVSELEGRLAKLEPESAIEGIPKEGALEDIRYPELLSRCSAEGFKGSVLLNIGDQATRTIYLRDGLPVGYASSEPGERIGKMMVEQGRITDDQYIKASMAMVERGIRLTEAMVELGFIEGEKLAVEMRNLTRDQIIRGFEITQGRFTTTEGVEPDESIHTFDFGPGEIYVQGYRRYAPKQEMSALFESMRDTYLKTNNRLAGFRPKLGLTSDDERLIRLLGEAYTVEEAVDKAGLDHDASPRVLAALKALNLVDEWEPGVQEFQTRLQTERQRHAEEIAKLREEMSEREQQLFQGFERALSKIGEVSSQSAPQTPKSGGFSAPVKSKTQKLDAPSKVVEKPSQSKPFQSPPVVAAKPASKPISKAVPAPKPSAKVTPPKAAPAEEKPKSTSGGYPGPDVGTVPTAENGSLSPADEKYAEGLEQAKQNKLDEAEVTLREAVRMDASRPDYLLSLAKVLLENPRYERSGTLPVVRSLLDRAVQIAPDDKDVRELHDEVVTEMGL